MADTTTVVNPKAAAIFRVLVGNAGYTGELIAGGVLYNPLPVSSVSANLINTLIPVKAALDAVTAPPPDQYTTGIDGTKTLNPAFTSFLTDQNAQPQPLLGYEQQFYALQAFINAINDSNTAITVETYCLLFHTNRVINNIISLSSLALAYNQTIQTMGALASLNGRADLSSIETVTNSSNSSNIINNGTIVVNGNAALTQVPSTSPKTTTPSFSDVTTTSYGNGYSNQVNSDTLQKIKTAVQIQKITAILTASGIPNVTFPTDVTLATINPSAHIDQLFQSILPTIYGGKSYSFLTNINNAISLNNIDLNDYVTINQKTSLLNNITQSVRNLVSSERNIWSDQMLNPETSPNGTVLQILNQMARCQSIVNMANDTTTQGILACCATSVTTQILQSS